MRVTPSAAPAFCRNERLLRGKVGHHLARLRLAQHCAARHTDDKVLPFPAVAPAWAAILPIGRFILFFVAKVGKRNEMIVHLKNDITAFAAIPAIWPTGRNIFFTAEGNSAVAPLPASILIFATSTNILPIHPGCQPSYFFRGNRIPLIPLHIIPENYQIINHSAILFCNF